MLGKCAWVFPLKRRFFSIIHKSYKLLAKCRKAEVPNKKHIYLNKMIRRELETVVALGPWLVAELRLEPCPEIFACDASVEGWAIVSLPSGLGFTNDSGLAETPHETHFLRSDKWRVRKSRWFRKRLDHCLAGEVCAFRQTCVRASRIHPGKDILIYTDNSNVYHAVRKGRSGAPLLNSLCRIVLLCEIMHNVRIHVRWCGTESMPADKYTRRATKKQVSVRRGDS